MTEQLSTVFGILIPFIGTTLGAALVFFMRRGFGERVRCSMLGFASGVMIAASVWSLLLPSIKMAAEFSVPHYLPATVGFVCGIVFLLALDKIIPNIRECAENAPSSRGALGRSTMLFLAVTLHNVPEGMAVGVAFAGVISSAPSVTMAEAMVLSIGIAVQNLPEGSIISLPLRADGMKKSRAFLYGTLSGVVEPIAAALTLALAAIISPILPYILSFAAGAMIYVAVRELIPEAMTGDGADFGILGAALGFALMMILDVALG